MFMDFAKSTFMGFSERGKLFVLTVVLSTASILVALLFAGMSATLLLVFPAILSILTVTKDVWSGEGSGGGGKSKLGMASLGVAVVALGLNQKVLVDPLLKPLLAQFPGLKLPEVAPSIAGLVFLGGVIFVVNYFAQDRTAMREHSTPLDKEFPEKDYKSLLRSFSDALLEELNKIDRETNWSAENFMPLDAEVEVQSGTKRLKKVTDLLTAIRSDTRSRVFLVLGDPGSGKSVALRKLCRDLLKEVVQTGKVPLYVNLREWETAQPWSEDAPPSVQQLYDFVLSNLKGRSDVFANDFLEKYYKKMFENGRLFFVLDSFDEIPAVLDVSENSWLIEKLSEVIHTFLAGAHESRGILASRIFRRPTSKFDAKTVLEIRPFTENKIVDYLKKSLFYDEALVSLLFNQRQELIPVARNPFTAALISSYAKDHDNTLPQTQAELYSSYIQQRLEACREKIEKKKLTDAGVFACAIDVADFMFTTGALGLEASVRDLRDQLVQHPVEDVIDVLKYARLGRLGAGDEHRFSFVHRRFNEYFVVQRLKEQPERVPQDAIPTDSRWRDALVLYCGVAEEERARSIAEFCWGEIDKIARFNVDMSDPQYMRAVHCLRFLKEAFRGRLQCVDSFRDELARYIARQISGGQNLLSQKIAVEAVGLLKQEDVEATLIDALDIRNPWIDETALKSCHYLPRLGEDLNRRLRLSIDRMSARAFLNRRKELMLSLKLSNVLSELRRYCRWRLAHIYCVAASAVLFVLLTPFIALELLVLYAVIKLFHAVSRIKSRDAKKAPGEPTPPRPLSTLSVSLMFPLILAASYALMLFMEARTGEHTLDAVLSPTGALLPYRVVLGLYALGMLLAIPWYQIYYYSGQFADFVRKARVRHIKYGLPMVAFLALYVWGVTLLSKVNETVTTVCIGLFAALFVVTMLWTFIRYVFSRYRDGRLLSKIHPPAALRRDQIAAQLGQFATQDGELQYVRQLQNAKVKPVGDWPGGHIPRPSSGEAATLLAKLEEQWLGLDR
ncbi:MAG: hypothetical protein QOE46_1876 [Acidobacteriota bacterium]|jgi:hypothetical protein|nr:hypothetical protein [Acidobacteriota bacterium]